MEERVMSGGNFSQPVWKKSSYSGDNGGNCVEVATGLGDVVAVRDSKDPNGPVLTFGQAEWGAFLARVKREGTDV